MTRTQRARARRRHHRRRWALNSIKTRRLLFAAMADIDCPGFRGVYAPHVEVNTAPMSITWDDVLALIDRLTPDGGWRKP